MKLIVPIALVALVLCAMACASNVHARYPSGPDDPTGRLVLILGQAADGVTVAVNGVLVVEDAHTERITIDGLPIGTAEIIIAANGADKAFRVWIGSEHPTTVPLGVPDEGSGFVKSLLGSLITIVVYSLLR